MILNRTIRDFDRDHPRLRTKLNKCLSSDLKLYTKIGFPECLTNLSNLIVMKMVKIIVEDG